MPHVRFSNGDDDADVDMEEAEEQEARAANATEEKGFKDPAARPAISSLQSIKTLSIASARKDDPDYVLDIALSLGERTMAASTSALVISLFSADEGAPLGDLRGHTGPISSIQFSATASPQTLISSSSDGTIRLWDLRSRTQVGLLCGDSGDELLGFSLGGSTATQLAAGSNAKVLFWDWRTQKRMGVLEEAHTEDVVQVAFHPNHPSKLVSASVDGLVCVFDTSLKIDDEESLETVMNVGTSVTRFGFYGTSLESLWCLTGIETLSLFRWEDGDTVAEFSTARDTAAGLWPLPSVDYFIRCVGGDNGSLALLGGTNEGTVGCFPISTPPREQLGTRASSRICHAATVLQGNHQAIVRAFEMMPEFERAGLVGARGRGQDSGERILCWTGGEDGKLCAWADNGLSGGHDEDGVAMGAGGPVFPSRRPGLSRQRHSPY